MSRGLKEGAVKLSRAREDFFLQKGREPTTAELSEISGESEEFIALALGASALPLSLTFGGEDGEELQLPVDAPDEEITNRLFVRGLVMNLEGVDRELIILRYFKNMTQTQVAKVLGMRQVQVSRREKKLLLKLRELSGEK